MERLSSKRTSGSKGAAGARGDRKVGTSKTVNTGTGATHRTASRSKCCRIGSADCELAVAPCGMLKWKVRVARLILSPQMATTIMRTRQHVYRYFTAL